MTPKERLIATLRGQKADAVPLYLKKIGFINSSDIEKADDPALREIARRIFNCTHEFYNVPSFINRYFVTPPQYIREINRSWKGENLTIESEIDTPKGKLTAITAHNKTTKTSWKLKYPVESLKDVEKIRSIPWELPSGLAPPDIAKLPFDFHRKCILRSGISSPFVCVAGMMPYQYFLELCIRELELIKELTEECKRRILDVLEVLLSNKAIEYVWMGGCEWITPPMGSPALYEELVQQQEREIISKIHEAGAFCHIHCHGNVRLSLEKVIQRKADYFEPVEPPPDGDIEFPEAKRIANGRITLGGNIEMRLVEREEANTVEKATKAAFEGGKQNMVLTTSEGPISKLTPRMLKNYHKIIDVWEELSPL